MVLTKAICPACRADKLLQENSERLTCRSCNAVYPLINNIPILIDDSKSVFTKQDFIDNKKLFFDTSSKGQFVAAVGRFLSAPSSRKGERNYQHLTNLLKQSVTKPRVLVLGGSIPGEGMEELLADTELDLVESDVSFGPRTQIILDAHNIPYEDESFDGVIAQAVLEHVLDPFKCVAEIHRVLKPSGLVYAETPFMQQVHGGPYDFHRFTHSGHRRLFKMFEEMDSGAVAGAGTAFAWSYQYLLLAVLGSTPMRRLLIKAFARVTGFWLKYLDHLTKWNPYSLEGASCLYFLGKKKKNGLSEIEIISYYRDATRKKMS